MFKGKTIQLKEEALSIVFYGLGYEKETDTIILIMYIFNHSDEIVQNIKFDYDLDLTAIGGKNVGKFNYQYIGEKWQNLSPKSVVPVFTSISNIPKIENAKGALY